MVRCVVSSCRNTYDTVRDSEKPILFHSFPKCVIMREGWIKAIGENNMPKKIAQARICSIHFEEDAYVKGNVKRRLQRGSQRELRRLLPHAVPTLNLRSSEQSRNNDTSVYNKIVQEFELPRPSVISQSESMLSTPGPSNMDTPTRQVKPVPRTISSLRSSTEKKSWLNHKFDYGCSPQLQEEYVEVSARKTFPECSQRLSKVLPRKEIKMEVKTTPRSKRKHQQSCSGAEEPAWKRRQRFINNDLPEGGMEKSMTTPEPQNNEDEDPYNMIKLLKIELQYHQAIAAFYK